MSTHAEVESTITRDRTNIDIYDDMTLKINHVKDALDVVIRSLPAANQPVKSTLRLLQHSLDDALDLAEELNARVQS